MELPCEPSGAAWFEDLGGKLCCQYSGLSKVTLSFFPLTLPDVSPPCFSKLDGCAVVWLWYAGRLPWPRLAEEDRAPDWHTCPWTVVPGWLTELPHGFPGCPTGLMVGWLWRMWVGGP